MAEKTMKAGKYELLADHFKQVTSKPGQPLEFIHHTRGDLVDLTAEDAERLKDVIAKPGEAARNEAARLRAAADAAQEKADAAAERVKAAEKDAKSAARTSGDGGGSGDEKPAGNASLEEWRTYALAHGATEADLEGKTRDEVRDTFNT